ncbi:hypothetical protein TNCV_388231 [Trichonephila clavipes]|nr:hypothetical protein TNCV_388231 [Trichonephila clavipes]
MVWVSFFLETSSGNPTIVCGILLIRESSPSFKDSRGERSAENHVRIGLPLGEAEIVFSDDEYVPPDEENISPGEGTLCRKIRSGISRKTTSGKKKQRVNKRKKLSDSNPDEMNSGTFVANGGT